MGTIKKNISLMVLSLVVITAIVYITVKNNRNSFDEEIFSSSNVMNHINELCSREYLGRMAGSEGNIKGLGYIKEFFEKYGIEPAGENGTYFQSFKTMMPDFGKNSEFILYDENGEIASQFEIFMDYNALTDMNGGGIDFKGEILVAGLNLLRIDPDLITGRVVLVTSNSIQPDQIAYVRENKGVGIICAADIEMFTFSRLHEQEKGLNASGKTGQSIFSGYISTDMYNKLMASMVPVEGDDRILPEGIIPSVKIKVDMTFPIIETANIMGKIEGKSKNGRYLLITANYDGAGEGDGIRYFPGAISNTSGIGVMLETARVLSKQENLPYETIVFIGWNGQQRQNAGSEYYLEHPIYPLDKTTIIQLEDLGYKDLSGLKISSDSIVSGILKDKISNYAEDAGLDAVKTGPIYNPAGRFSDYGAAGVMLSDIFFRQDSYSDASYSVNEDRIRNAGMVLLNYIKRETYGDTAVDYLNTGFIALISCLALILFFNILIGRLYKLYPSRRFFKHSMEEIYFSGPVMTVRRILRLAVPVLIALFLLVFIVNIDPDTNISTVNNELTTNFSLFLTLKKTLLYFQDFFSPASSAGDPRTLGTILGAALRSLLLMLSSLLLAVLTGITRGLSEGYRSKRKNLRSLGTLVVFSIPDVLVVMAGLLLYVFIAKSTGLSGTISLLRKFILPLVTLTILPAIYIARITYITVQDEIRLEYIMNAKAKGLSRRKIFTSELLPAVSFRIVDSLPAITTMLFSNMIIVEYLLNYLGIMNYLIYFYNRQNINGFILTALTMGIIYILLTWGVQIVAGYINPLKRRH